MSPTTWPLWPLHRVEPGPELRRRTARHAHRLRAHQPRVDVAVSVEIKAAKHTPLAASFPEHRPLLVQRLERRPALPERNRPRPARPRPLHRVQRPRRPRVQQRRADHPGPRPAGPALARLPRGPGLPGAALARARLARPRAARAARAARPALACAAAGLPGAARPLSPEAPDSPPWPAPPWPPAPAGDPPAPPWPAGPAPPWPAPGEPAPPWPACREFPDDPEAPPGEAWSPEQATRASGAARSKRRGPAAGSGIGGRPAGRSCIEGGWRERMRRSMRTAAPHEEDKRTQGGPGRPEARPSMAGPQATPPGRRMRPARQDANDVADGACGAVAGGPRPCAPYLFTRMRPASPPARSTGRTRLGPGFLALAALSGCGRAWPPRPTRGRPRARPTRPPPRPPPAPPPRPAPAPAPRPAPAPGRRGCRPADQSCMEHPCGRPRRRGGRGAGGGDQPAPGAGGDPRQLQSTRVAVPGLGRHRAGASVRAVPARGEAARLSGQGGRALRVRLGGVAGARSRGGCGP